MARKKGQVTAAEGELVYELSAPSGWLTEERMQAEVDRRIDDLLAGKTKAMDAREVTERVFAAARRRRGDR